MRTTLVWDKHRMAATVRNDENAGQPWLGIVRCEPLVDDQWKATTTIYEKPIDLGLFATPEAARDALVAEAEARAARIEHAKAAHLTSFRGAA